MKLRKSLKHKCLLFSLTSLALVGAIVPTVACQKTTSKTNSKDYQIDPSQNNKYGIEDSRYFNFNSIDPENPNRITSIRLQDHINAVLDKTQYRLYAVGCTQNEVNTTIGSLKANINNRLNAQKLGSQLYSTQKENDDATNAQVYQYVNDQAKIFGTSVIDYDELYFTSIPEATTQFSDTLMNAGCPDDRIQTAVENYEDIMVSKFNSAVNGLFDEIQYSTQVEDTMSTSSVLNPSYLSSGIKAQNDQDTKLDASLAMVSDYFVNKLNSGDAEINPEGLQIFKDFSIDNQGIDHEQNLTDADVEKLLNFNYDLSYGADFSQISIDYNIAPTSPVDNYDQNIISKLTLNQSLGNLHTQYATFGENEIIPNYGLKVRFISLDDTTDSNSCTLKLQFGQTFSANPDHIWWMPNSTDITIPKNLSISNKEFNDLKDGYNSYDVSLSKYPQLIKNVTNNVYSNPSHDNYDSFVANLDGNTPNEFGYYFSDSIDKRGKLDKIMEKYKSSSKEESNYNLSKNPVILESSDYEGIDVPSSLKPYLDKTWHKNQSLALIANGIDTNTNTLKIHWAIINKNIEGGDYTNNDFIVVKDIPWTNNTTNDLYDSITVQFEISEELQNKIQTSSRLSQTLVEFANASQTIANFGTHSFFGKVTKFAKDSVNLQTAAMVSLAATIVISVVTIAVLILSWGAAGGAGGTLAVAINVIAVILSTISIIISQVDYKATKEIRNFSSELNKQLYQFSDDDLKQIYSNINDMVQTSIIPNYDILNDSTATYSRKDSAADAILNNDTQFMNQIIPLENNKNKTTYADILDLIVDNMEIPENVSPDDIINFKKDIRHPGFDIPYNVLLAGSWGMLGFNEFFEWRFITFAITKMGTSSEVSTALTNTILNYEANIPSLYRNLFRENLSIAKFELSSYVEQIAHKQNEYLLDLLKQGEITQTEYFSESTPIFTEATNIMQKIHNNYGSIQELQYFLLHEGPEGALPISEEIQTLNVFFQNDDGELFYSFASTVSLDPVKKTSYAIETNWNNVVDQFSFRNGGNIVNTSRDNYLFSANFAKVEQSNFRLVNPRAAYIAEATPACVQEFYTREAALENGELNNLTNFAETFNKFEFILKGVSYVTWIIIIFDAVRQVTEGVLLDIYDKY